MKPSLLLHLVRKDIRAFRVPLILMWLAMAWMAFVPISSESAALSRVLFLSVVSLLVLVEILALQLDPTKGTSQFLRTRPVSAPAQALSKLIFLLLVCLLPIVIVQMIQTQRAELGMAFRDYVWLWTQALLIFLGVTGIVSPFALHTKNMAHLIAALLCGCVLITGAGLMLLEQPEIWMDTLTDLYWRWFPQSSGYQNDLTRKHLAFALLGCTGFAVTFCRYLNWKSYWKVLAAACGLALTALCLRSCPFSLLPSAEGTPEQKQTVQTALQSVSLESIPYHWWAPSDPTYLLAYYQIRNLPDPYFLEQTGWSSTVRFADGKTLSRSRTYPTYAGVKSPFVSHFLDLGYKGISKFPPDDYRKKRTIVFAEDPTSRWRPALTDFQASVVSGDVHFDAYEAFIAAELPIIKGATYVKNGSRIRIVDVQPDTSFPVMEMEIASFDWCHPLSAYFAQRTKTFHGGVRLGLGDGGIQTNQAPLYPSGFKIHRWQQGLNLRWFNAEILASDWKTLTRLHIFGSRRVGAFTSPVELRDVAIGKPHFDPKNSGSFKP